MYVEFLYICLNERCPEITLILTIFIIAVNAYVSVEKQLKLRLQS